MSSKKNAAPTVNATKENAPKVNATKINVNEKQKIIINRKDQYKSQASFLEISALGFHSWKVDHYRRRNFGPKTFRHSVYGFSTEHLAPRRE